jgi:myo-inositol-hexaphosphate 3-phosphohydrolase
MVKALVAMTLLLVACRAGNVPSELPAGRDVFPLDFELDGPGVNVDDPCFWVNPADPAASLLFVTTKDSALVEVFNLVTGALVTTIGGFGKPNNCAVEGDLLLTADRKANHVTVHHLPDFRLLRTFADDMRT